MKGATSSPSSRHVSTRSPRMPLRRSPAAGSARAPPAPGPGGGRGGVARGARTRPPPAEIAGGHRDGAIDEVAEVVGEIGVVAAHEGVPAHVAVAVESDLAQQDVTGAVGAQHVDDRVRVQEVAAALAHALAPYEQPAVDPDLARRLDARTPEHGRPVDRLEARDVLADDVQVGRPPAREV